MKFNRRIIQAAFDEVDASRAEQIRNDAQRRGQGAEFDAYRDMRLGLNLLKDIPEDQLSHERIRTAILAEGLNRRESGSERGWGFLHWASACMVASVIAYTAISTLRAPGAPRFVESESPVAMGLNPQLDFPTAKTGVKASAPTPTPAKAVATRPVTTDERPVRRKRVRRTPTPADSDMALVALSNPIHHAGPASAPVRSVQEPATEGPIVLIEPSPSSDTGTRATEQESVSNVLVGG